MNVIILSGGYAERLWPLTEDFPKTMLRLAGKPVIYFLLENLARIPGISSITIAIDENRKDFFLNSMDEINVISTIRPQFSIHNLKSDGTIIGPLAKLCEILDKKDEFEIKDEDYLVVGGDNVFCFDLNRIVKYFREKETNCIAIQKHLEPIDASSFGVPTLDESGNVKGLKEKPQSTSIKFISTACYCLKQKSLQLVSKYIANMRNDNLGAFIDWLSHKTPITSYQFEDEWYDIGTRHGLLCANSTLMRLNYTQIKLPEMMRNETHIHNPIYSEASTVIKDSSIGPNVYIGSDCTIIQSKVRNSIIYDGCVLRNCNLKDAVIGEKSIIEGNISEAIFGPYTKSMCESKKF